MRSSLTRRQFLQASIAGSLSMAALGRPAFASTKTRRKPNLLFLWTDQQRADTMAVYGNKKIQTHNLNKLASQSIVFKNAYVSQAICTPSRSTVMTGLWPHTTGLIKNNIPLPENVPCFPEIVNDPDYRTAYLGKWHLGDEIFAQHGFEEWAAIEDMYTKHYRNKRDQSKRSHYHHFLIEHGYSPDREDQKFSRQFACNRPLEHCKPKFLESRACDFMRRHRNEPFILYVNFLEPHMPYFGPLDDIYDPAKVDLPPNYNDPLEANEPLRCHWLRNRYREQGYEGHNLKTEQGWRNLTAKYWGLVTQVDLSVGAILKTLEELELAENTIVVYTSDHGDMMGSHQLLAKTVMYEESVKVPWLMRIPQLNNKGKVIEKPVSHIDMVPTLLDLMGCKPKEDLPGQSLVPLIKGCSVPHDHVFIEWNAGLNPSKPAPDKKGGKEIKLGDIVTTQAQIEQARNKCTRTVVSPDGWKLCLSDADKCQLFNLRKDPFETTNLYYSGRHDDIIDMLRRKIHAWQKKVNDTSRYFL